MTAILDEHKNWETQGGKPLVNGQVYFGVRNQDSKLNPITIYEDSALQIPTSNPQTTDAFGQTEDKIYVEDFYSILVEDEEENLIYSEQDNGSGSNIGASIALDDVQGTNDLTAEGSPAILFYVDKQTYILKTTSLNDGAMTLNAGGGVVDIKIKGVDIVDGQFPANSIMELVFNSTGPTFEVSNGHNFAVPQSYGQTKEKPIKGSTVTATTEFDGKLGVTAAKSAKVTTLEASTSIKRGAGAITVLGDTATLAVSTVKVPANTSVINAINAATLGHITKSGVIIQVQTTQSSAKVFSTVGFPYDDSIPQRTEGFEVMTRTFIPKFATSKILIVAKIMANFDLEANLTAAIFKDVVSNALAAEGIAFSISGGSPIDTPGLFCLQAEEVAGSISSRTYKVRLGANSSGGTRSVTFNGLNNLRIFGTAPKSSITVYEIGV